MGWHRRGLRGLQGSLRAVKASVGRCRSAHPEASPSGGRSPSSQELAMRPRVESPHVDWPSEKEVCAANGRGRVRLNSLPSTSDGNA